MSINAQVTSVQPSIFLSSLMNAEDVDPLDVFTLPPPNESPSDRLVREKLEQDATERSRSIDAELKVAKAAMKQHKKAVKILMLGQSQSGEYFSSPFDTQETFIILLSRKIDDNKK